MKNLFKLNCVLLFVVLFGCNRKINHDIQLSDTEQNLVVGGGCDGCEIMFKGMPRQLSSVDTSEGWNEAGQKLVVEGKVFKQDMKTLASNVVIYYWHTDNNGLYSKTSNEKTIHGHLRGWLKTDQDGNFKIFTVRPATYPKTTIPAHIHFSIKEPNIANEYFIDDLLFEDDKLLTQFERDKLKERGGNGIGKTTTINNVQFINRNIILGLNIPNYPK